MGRIRQKCLGIPCTISHGKLKYDIEQGGSSQMTRPDVEVAQKVLTEWKRNLKSREKAGEGHLGESLNFRYF
jgi:hypothetical protein